MIDLKFDLYKFYSKGYTSGFTSEYLSYKFKNVIKNTNWIEGHYPKYADWSILEPMPGQTDDLYFEEIIRNRLAYGRAPTELRCLANEFIDSEFFEPFKNSLVKVQHQQYRNLRNIKPFSFGLWNGQESLAWHNDTSDLSDFFVLMYFNDYEVWDKSWGGQLHVGNQNESGDIVEVFQHDPIDSTFVVINNQNPLFYHSITANDRNKDRIALSISYKIE